MTGTKRQVGFFCNRCGKGFELENTKGERVFPDYCPFCGTEFKEVDES